MTNEPDVILTALHGLLAEYRKGRIVSRSNEREGIEQHAGGLTAHWNERFPGFPNEDFPYTSFRGENRRGRRDAHLVDIIIQLLAGRGLGATVVNPTCVFGRHAIRVASRLGDVRVVGTDIDPRWHRLCRLWRLGHLPQNFVFVQDNIFAPRLELSPTAVVFFGACGALSDATLDYAVESRAEYVIGRTCCHDNIAGNVKITPRPNPVNRFFRFKNLVHDQMQTMPKYAGFYFSPRYDQRAYPRSFAGRSLSTSAEFLAVARDSVDSDICRAIIDLDRCLYLVERGFHVEYQGELVVAERLPRGHSQAVTHLDSTRQPNGSL